MDRLAPAANRLATQRVAGTGRLAVRHVAGRSRLAELYQEGAAKIRLPRVSGDGTSPAEAILINTAGGMTGGDRLGWSLHVGEDAALTVTTQACEKIYRSAGGLARQATRISIAARGRIAWLPQEAILFNGCAMARSLDVELAEDATGVFSEALLFGRTARGETVERAMFQDRWHIRIDGRLVHAEALSIGPDVQKALRAAAGSRGGCAVATVLMVGEEAQARLDGVRALLGDTGGASWSRIGGTGKLLARLVASDGYALRQRLAPLLGLLNGQAGLPKIWTL